MPSKRPSGRSKLQEILLPYFAAARGARHRGERGGALQADRGMAHAREGGEVPARPAAEIQNRERRCAFDMPQQRRNILADVVIACAGRKLFGTPLVVRERAGGNLL